MPQKATSIAVVQQKALIYLIYNGGPKKAPQYVTYSGSFRNCRKKPTTIARFSCSVNFNGSPEVWISKPESLVEALRKLS